MNTSSRIDLLADHPQMLDMLARWHRREWGHTNPGAALDWWTDHLASRASRDGIPMSLVALIDGTPAGSVSLVAHDMSVHEELTPWLAGLYVLPEHRRRGIGSALVGAIEDLAANLGVRALYLYTRSAGRLYRSLGWRVICTEEYEGREVDVMEKQLA